MPFAIRMIVPSKHTIFSKIKDSEKYFLVNPLSGNADILDTNEAEKFISGNTSSDPAFIEKGYFIASEDEAKLYKDEYLRFTDERDRDEVQLFFVPNYSCNFACSYCYQDEYANEPRTADRAVIDAFFRYIKKEFAGRRVYVTLFGGEPLLPGDRQKETIRYFASRTKEAGIDLCVVTNGYTLSGYIEILKEASIREIQVTLDGTRNVHDSRRFLKGGLSTFDAIVKGIDACLENRFPVNLRIVVDKDNIENLPELATFAIEKGWTGNALFKTQIGRNYELHHCNSSPEKLFSRLALYEKIFRLIQQHPQLEKFYKPSYSITRYISENGSLPDPLFDSCPACKTEWAFDYTGSIYSCTATVGKRDEKLATFYPHEEKNENMISQWQERDVTSIEQCRGCNLQLACGGGCGSVAKNRNGTILSPDCRPVKELLELGFAAYLDKK